jgi:hypothetical protein
VQGGEEQSNVQSPTSKGKAVRSAEGEEKPPDAETPFDKLPSTSSGQAGRAVTRGRTAWEHGGEDQSNVQSPRSKGKAVRSAEGEVKSPDTGTPFDALRLLRAGNTERRIKPPDIFFYACSLFTVHCLPTHLGDLKCKTLPNRQVKWMLFTSVS